MDGSDLNSGDSGHPFKTIEQARNAVRANDNRGSRPIIVNIREGFYRLERALGLTSADSGGPGAEVTYRAADGAEVVISGARRVTGWSRPDDNSAIWSAPADTNGRMPRQLYVNGRRATRARTPDYPDYYAPIATGYSYEYDGGEDPPNPPDWKRPSLVEAVTVTQWKMMRCPVEKVEGNEVVMQNDCWKNANVFPYPWNFHLLSWWENAYEFLDEPGEWYLNPVTRILYYIPLAGEDMLSADTEVELPVLEKLIYAAGDVATPVEHIRFEGLSFMHATWYEPNGSDGYALDQSGFHLKGPNHEPNLTGHDPDTVPIPGNVDFLYARNITFKNNEFAHLGAVALNFGTGSQENRIINNSFNDISAAAIQVGSNAVRDHHPEYESQLSRDNHISNNLIEYSGQEFYDAPGIYIGFTTRSLVEHNEIRHVPWTGIAIGWGWGMLDPGGFAGLDGAVPYQWGHWDTPSAQHANRIEHNKIEYFLEQLWDGGAIYSTGFQGTSMEDGLFLGWNVARYKRPFGGGNTFYTDGGSRYVTLRQNVSLDNPPGYVDFGPCDKASSFSDGKLCELTGEVLYGADMGGCIPYGDMLFDNNFLLDPVIFYDICYNENFPDAPTDLQFAANVMVISSDEVPAWILESAGRQ